MNFSNKKILVTGAAGFIGYHLVNKLILENAIVIGLDNLNNYYEISLKIARLNEAGIDKNSIYDNEFVVSIKFANYKFIKADLCDKQTLLTLFEKEKFDYVVNLAAQAGVRYSIENPDEYINSNIIGFMNLLECCRAYPVKHLVYASSSSVYGMNKNIPFSVKDNVDHPISLYASTKKSNELMAHSYSHLFKMSTTGLRFFTVYGPWGRPDMAYFSFSKNILNNKEIKVYNNGSMRRDFTFISDIIDGILASILSIPTKNEQWDGSLNFSSAGYRIFNLGNNKPVELLDFIHTLEEALNTKAIIKFAELQDGDVLETWADIDITQNELQYKPKVEIKEGIKIFADWFKNYYKNGIEK
jgi:UDP-glucuronate 4-epimerase